MLKAGAPIFVTIPEESEAPVYHPGRVLESNSEGFLAEFSQLPDITEGSSVCACGEVGGKFFQQQAVVKEICRISPPVLRFHRVGNASSAEKRTSFRVRTTKLNLAARIGAELRCPVTDVSPEGFGAVTSTPLAPGDTITVQFEYENQVFEGEVRVQSASALPNGRRRTGFWIPERSGKMRRLMERIASSVQRRQLRTMAGFKALDQDAEVNGETIFSIIDALDEFKSTALKILEKQGIVDPQPGEWYNQQAWLDAFTAISEKLGSDALFNIGFKTPKHSHFPPGIDCLDKALSLLDVAFHMNHRNGEVGHYELKIPGEKTFELVCRNPYPCDFDRGVLVALCQRFVPKGASVHAMVIHDDSKPCRKQGGNSCTYLIRW